MNAKSFGFFLLGISVTFLAVVVAWRENHLTRSVEDSIRVVLRKRASAGLEIRRLEERIETAAKEHSNLQFTADQLRKSSATPSVAVDSRQNPPPPTVRAEQINEWLKKYQEEQNDPAVELLELAWRRSRVSRTYGSFFQSMGLSREKIEKFHTNAAKRDEQQMDLQAIMRRHGLTLMNPEMAKLWLQIEPEYQAAQRALLGETEYPRFQEYERTAPTRDMVAGMAGAAVLAGTPFTREQMEQLSEILAKTNANYLRGGIAFVPSVDWDVVDAQVKTILSDPQFVFFKTIDPGGGRAWGRFSQVINQAMNTDHNAPTLKSPGR